MPDVLVTVAVYNDVVAAETAKGLLQAHGIRAFVMDAHANSLTPQLLSPMIGVRIQVPRSEAKDAIFLLEGLTDTPPTLQPEEEEEEEDYSPEREESDRYPSRPVGLVPGGYSGSDELSREEEGHLPLGEPVEGQWDDVSPTSRMASSSETRRLFLTLVVLAAAAFVVLTYLM